MGEMMIFIVENFWIILMILALLCMKGHRAGAVVLLGDQIIWGGNTWLTIAVVVVSVVVEAVHWWLHNGHRFRDNSKSGCINIPSSTRPRRRRDPDYD